MTSLSDAIVAIVAILRAHATLGVPAAKASAVRLIGWRMGIQGKTWGCAVRHLRGHEMIVENDAADTWSLGVDSDTIDTSYIDKRAMALTAPLIDMMKEEGTTP